MHSQKTNSVFVTAILAIAGISTSTAIAQEQQSEAFVIEEIVVTAQKRDRSISDVSSAINVVGGETIRDLNLQTARDFIQLTPSAIIQESTVGITTDIALRGIGTPGDLVEPGVGVYVDEMYAGGLRTVAPQFYDLERVEVLRGTQAGLYGRNAVGGAFLYITGRPQQEKSGRVELKFGSNELTEISGTYNTPLSDSAALRFTGWALQQNGGDLTNGITGDSLNERDLYGGRLSALFGLSDAADLLLTVEHSQQESPTGQLFFIPGGPTIVGELEDKDSIYRDTDSSFDTQFTRVTAKMDWESNIGEWTAVLGYRNYDLDALEDQDFSARNFLEVDPATLTLGTFANRDLDRQETIDTTYAEIRLASPDTGSNFEWMLGLNYFGESGDFVINQIVNPPLLGGPNVFLPVPPFDPTFTAENTQFDRRVSQDTDSVAAFVTLGYRFNDRWDLSGGLRYTSDSKDTDFALDVGNVTAALTGATPFSATPSETFSNTSPELTLTFAAGDEWNIYARAAAGFRAGGVNVLISDPALFRYDEETSVNYEIGAKGNLFDGRGYTAFTLFMTKREDVLLGFSPAPLQFALQNAGESESYGAEIDFSFQVADGFTIGGNAGFYGSEITSVAPGFPATEGNDAPNLPDVTFSLLANYVRPISSNLDLIWSLNYRNADGGFLDAANTVDLPSYGLLNLSLGIGGERWQIIAYGNNVTDDTYQLTDIPFILSQTIASLAPPPFFEALSGRSENAGANYGIRLIAQF